MRWRRRPSKVSAGRVETLQVTLVDGSGAHSAPEGNADPRWADVPLLQNSMLGNGWIQWYGPMSWDVRHDLTLPSPPDRPRRAWREQLGQPTVPFAEVMAGADR